MAREWQPITDIGDDAGTELVHEELRHLVAVWHEQKDQIDENLLREFNARLHRTWAIHTGLIERIYTLDCDAVESLVEQGINATLIRPTNGDSPERIAAVLNTHIDALEGLFEFINSERTLSISYIKQLHQELLQDQSTTEAMDQFGNLNEISLQRGVFKNRHNNPYTPQGEIHEYCPPEHTESEMERLLEIHLQQQKQNLPPLLQAAWLHHRFIQIHPFQDGNGRVARCLASLVLIKAGWFPLVVLNEQRDEYIDALESADRGDLSKLIEFFADRQKQIIDAISIVDNNYQKTKIYPIVSTILQELLYGKGRLASEMLIIATIHKIVKKLIQGTTKTIPGWLITMVINSIIQELRQKEQKTEQAAGKRNVLVLVDGYNIFYSVCELVYPRHNKQKSTWDKKYLWYDLFKLAGSCLESNEKIAKLYYCSAEYRGKNSAEVEQIKVQKSYVQYHRNKYGNTFKFPEGKFSKERKLISCPKCKRQLQQSTEKQTDVNIAVRMMAGAYTENYGKIGKIILISADTDYEPVFENIAREKKEIELVRMLPPGMKGNKDTYPESSKCCIKEIDKATLKKTLFPKPEGVPDSLPPWHYEEFGSGGDGDNAS